MSEKIANSITDRIVNYINNSVDTLVTSTITNILQILEIAFICYMSYMFFKLIFFDDDFRNFIKAFYMSSVIYMLIRFFIKGVFSI